MQGPSVGKPELSVQSGHRFRVFSRGLLWGYARDDRPWNGPLPPAAVYAEDRKGKRPREHLEPFTGTLKVDAYAGFNALANPGRPAGPLTLAILIAANQPFGEWGEIFPDQAMTLAAADRLVHHTILEMNVESYRRRATIQRTQGPGRPPSLATTKNSS